MLSLRQSANWSIPHYLPEFDCATRLHGDFILMLSRRFFSTCGLMLLLVPSSGWALNESENSLGAQSAPELTSPTKSTPELTSPPKIAPASAIPSKPAPELAAPAKIAPASAIPSKPAPVLAAPAKIAPASAVPSKSAPNLAAPAKHQTPQAAHVETLPMPSALQATTKQPSIDVNSQFIDIEVFVREECQNCEQAKEFLAKLKKFQPRLSIAIRDVRKEPAALELLKRMTQNQGDVALDYPAFVVGGQLIIGFSEEESTAQRILDTLEASHPQNLQTGDTTQNCETGKEPSCGLIPPAPVTKQENITIELFGYNIPLLQIGMPAFTLAMGLLDGLSHGSPWVLILLISLLAPMKNRTFMFAIASTFIAVQGIVYFILITIWLNIFLQFEISPVMQIAIAGFSLIAGAFYLKKYAQYGQNLSISSHEIANPGIYTRIRKIVEAESYVKAILGAALLAVLVLASEFTYTSVYPALYTQTLNLHNVGKLNNYGYLLLYDFSYMLSNIMILAIGVITLKQPRPRDKGGRMIKLLGGLTLVALGIYLLLTQT